MTDKDFINDADRRWKALLDKAAEWDASTTATAVALWATLNVDRLIEIARRSA